MCCRVANTVAATGHGVDASAAEITMKSAVHRITGANAIPAFAMPRARLTSRHRRTWDDASFAVVLYTTTLTPTTIPESCRVGLVADALARGCVAPAMVVAPSAVRGPSAEAFIRFGEVESHVGVSEHVEYILALVRQDGPTTLAEAKVAMTAELDGTDECEIGAVYGWGTTGHNEAQF